MSNLLLQIIFEIWPAKWTCAPKKKNKRGRGAEKEIDSVYGCVVAYKLKYRIDTFVSCPVKMTAPTRYCVFLRLQPCKIEIISRRKTLIKFNKYPFSALEKKYSKIAEELQMQCTKWKRQGLRSSKHEPPIRINKP